MKRIEALIRREKLCEMKDALVAVGVDDVTISDVRGTGRQQVPKRSYRGGEYTVDFVPRTRLDVLVSDALCTEVVEAILTMARTGAAGDGMILVRSFADAVPVDFNDAGGSEHASASLPADKQADVPNEPVLSHQRMGAAAMITGLIKLLALAGARWHEFLQ